MWIEVFFIYIKDFRYNQVRTSYVFLSKSFRLMANFELIFLFGLGNAQIEFFQKNMFILDIHSV